MKSLIVRTILIFTWLIALQPCMAHAADSLVSLENQIEAYVADKDARIGVAVITEQGDTLSIRGREQFPMLSVYKFPQALAVADYCVKNNRMLSDSIFISSSEILENTWSPMRDRYGVRDLRLPIRELLDYTLTQSDNNACDILFRLIGGTSVADSLMRELGYTDIHIRSTEDEMHRDLGLCYINSSSPIAMAKLFLQFYREELLVYSQASPTYDKEQSEANYREKYREIYKEIGGVMLGCTTGLSRLPAPLTKQQIRIGHKTGTGDTNEEGRIIAINDAGYVFLPQNKGYAVAVFISDSAYDVPATEKIIAYISEMILNTVYADLCKSGD